MRYDATEGRMWARKRISDRLTRKPRISGLVDCGWDAIDLIGP